jgi:hypothetical protein
VIFVDQPLAALRTARHSGSQASARIRISSKKNGAGRKNLLDRYSGTVGWVEKYLVTQGSTPLAPIEYLNECRAGSVLAYTISMWLLKRVHTYAGLLALVNLAVYGVVGLSVAFLRESGEPHPVIRYQNFSMEPNLTDRQVAERVRAQLNLSFADPVNKSAIEHDAVNNLLLDFRDANGSPRVTVLEKEGRLRIETIRNSFGIYLYILHGRTASFHAGDWRMRLWSDYNEFAMWCLLTMIASGFAMFLTARARNRLAQISLAAGCCLFAALYFWSR